MNTTKGDVNQQNTLADELLRGTARSFYLTLHALPKAIRWPISLGYLLARATDTVADVVDLPGSSRLASLALMREMINNGLDPEKAAQWESGIASFATVLKTNPMEYKLLCQFNQLIQWLYEEEARNELILVLNTIIQGQVLDIERFPLNGKIHYLRTIDELDQYTYLVAGCVGEFWTKLCIKRLPDYSSKPQEELYPLAIALGKGLQLINVLRDIPSDLHTGRCYLPEEQLQQYGLTSKNLLSDMGCLKPIVHYWLQKAVDDLKLGWEYMLSLRYRQIRSAVALPLLLGFATLKELKPMTYLDEKQPIKISRKRVKFFMFIALLGMISKKFFSLVNLNKFY